MYKVPCNNPFILFSPDSWSKPAQLFKSQLLATAYTSPWGYASVILLWSCMSNGINSHKKCMRRQPKVSNPTAVLNFWNSDLSSFSIALLKFSLLLQSIQRWSLGKFAFLYIFQLCTPVAFSRVPFVEVFFSNSSPILYSAEWLIEVNPVGFSWQYTSLNTQSITLLGDARATWTCGNNDIVMTIP